MFRWFKRTPEPTPIADTIREAMNILGMREDPEKSGFLTQAEVIRELARRVAEIEKRHL